MLKEALENSKSMRVCKRNLWDVNHRSGWTRKWLSIANFQPVGTAELRAQAFARWNIFPEYVLTEIENLKKRYFFGVHHAKGYCTSGHRSNAGFTGL